MPPISVATANGARVEETLRLDGNEQDFSVVADVAVARDGSIFVADWQDASIRVFGPDGAPRATFGRKGAGPGEFRRLNRIGWRGDTLWVYDGQLHRISLFARDTFARSLDMPGVARPQPRDSAVLPSFSFLYFYGLGLNDTMLVQAGTAMGQQMPSGYVKRGGMPYIRVAQGGGIGAQLGWTPKNTAYANYQTSPRSGGSVGIPFAAEPLGDVSQDGLRIATMELDAEASPPTLHLVVWGIHGDTTVDRRLTFVPERIPAQRVDSAFEERFASMKTDLAVATLKAVRRPTIYAPATDLLLASDSTIWIRLRPANGIGRWVWLSANGEPLDTLPLPDAVRIVEARRDVLYATASDDDDVESVLRLRVVGAIGREKR